MQYFDTLGQLVAVILAFPFIVRLVMIGFPIIRIVRLFEGQLREGVDLFLQLEIPGIREFVRTEVALLTIPYVFAALLFWATDMMSIRIDDISTIAQTLIIGGLIAWVVGDWFRSYYANQRLQMIVDELGNIKNVSGSVLDGLRFIVYVRSGIKRTVVRLGLRALWGSKKKKMEESEEPGKKGFAEVAKVAIEQMFLFPERMMGALTDWMKEGLDNILLEKFKQYTERSNQEILFIATWIIIPPIWTGVILYFLQ
jgi:hypothetical protein